jgi:hypothetical protein
MKTTVILAASFFAAATLHAQSFTAAPGYSSTQAFRLEEGISISALGASAAGDLYYLASGRFDGNAEGTQLFRASPVDNFSNPVSLFSYRTGNNEPLKVFGSFVRVDGGTVYFGESSTGEIRSIPLSGGISGVVRIVPNHYDAAVTAGNIFLSAADQSFSNNQIYRVTPGATPLDRTVNTGGASGPLAVDSAGNLIYGASTFLGGTGGLYRFTAAQVAAVSDANPAAGDSFLSLADGTRLFGSGPAAFSGGSQYLAYRDDAHLFQADSPFGAAATIQRFDLTQTSRESVGQSGMGQFFGGLALTGSTLYAAVSTVDGNSAVFMIIPEPTVAGLLTCSLLTLGGFSRRRRAAEPAQAAL